jgi:hypothetical protein
VHQLRFLTGRSRLQVRGPPLLIEIQAPVLDQVRGGTLAFERLSVIGLDLELPAPVEVLEVSSDGPQIPSALVQHLDHDLGCPPHGAGDGRDVRRR